MGSDDDSAARMYSEILQETKSKGGNFSAYCWQLQMLEGETLTMGTRTWKMRNRATVQTC